MEPVYLDLHIHTSENPNKLNENYNVDILIDKIKNLSHESDFLISLTDHNTINKKAYLDLIKRKTNILLGAELHIRNDKDKPPYHCHIFFNTNINEEEINKINIILNDLYPNKEVKNTDEKIPNIQDIINNFEQYDILLLPHAGQSHSTFDKSISKGKICNNSIEKNIYYNHFEGFTARGQTKLEKDRGYFKDLGMGDFINLVTCSDNYSPEKYPSPKEKGAEKFVPTWMLALPTFEGLRISLSESSRLCYSEEKPESWTEHIREVKLKNNLVDIDINLTPGLNVVIGESSSGKTLLVDSIYRKLSGEIDTSEYKEFGVSQIEIKNPAKNIPHYISQNYITEIINKENIEDIEIISRLFPENDSAKQEIRDSLNELKENLINLFKSVKGLEEEDKKIGKIPTLSKLILKNSFKENIIDSFLPDEKLIRSLNYDKSKFRKDSKNLKKISEHLAENPLLDSDFNTEINSISNAIILLNEKTLFESKIRKILEYYFEEVQGLFKSESKLERAKNTNYKKLKESIKKYSSNLRIFQEMKKAISSYDIKEDTNKTKFKGHTLYIENQYSLSKEKIIEVLNSFLKKASEIKDFDAIDPFMLILKNFNKTSIKDYDSCINKTYHEFEKLNKITYKIRTENKKDFDKLSAGWKTGVLLDLILGHKEDLAPIIIDQPEDNLANSYINNKLIKEIKEVKADKQIIVVSHNATIPMMGDAQNIIVCQIGDDNKIIIKSGGLEEEIEGKKAVDHIVQLTDGGKASIKKRVKKYNLKKFEEEK